MICAKCGYVMSDLDDTVCPRCQTPVTLTKVTPGGSPAGTPPPESMAVVCPQCQVSGTISAVRAGQTITCTQCGTRFPVPTRDIPQADTLPSAAQRLTTPDPDAPDPTARKGRLWQWIFLGLMGLALVCRLIGCLGGTSRNKAETLLQDVSGVWSYEADFGDSGLLTLDVAEKSPTIMVDGTTVPVTVTQVDTDNDVVTLEVRDDGERYTWSFRQDWDADHKRFNLIWTTSAGKSVDLTFVRGL